MAADPLTVAMMPGVSTPAQQAPAITGPSVAGSLKYGLLRQTHAAEPPHDRGYDIDVWRELDDLYRGGYQIQENAEKYLPKSINEDVDRWKERLILAAYIGYFGRITQAYVGAIFDRSVAVAPAGDAEDPETPGELPDREVYDAFARNADLKGCSFEQLLRHATTTALVKGKVLIAVDFPSAPTKPTTRADEDAIGGARPYAYVLEPECLTEWEVESEIQRQMDLGAGRKVEWTVGRFSWCIVKRVLRSRPSPDALRSEPVEEYRIWRKRDDGVVIWQVYRTPPIKNGQRLDDNTEIPLVAEGDTKFREIPIVEIRFPDPLWLGNVIGPLNLEHWRRRSALLAAEQRTLLVIPTIFLGPEVPGFQQPIMSETQQDPERGNLSQYEKQGYKVLGKDDRLEFPGPNPAPYEVIDKQVNALVDEIYRVAGQMAAGLSSTKGGSRTASGLSKAYDHKDFTTVVSAIAAIIADGARRVYTTISDARGEQVVWTVHGLSGYEEMEDRDQLLQEALQVDAIDIPSPTFQREYRVDLARKLLPGRDPATQATIRKEIVANTPDEVKQPAAAAPPESGVEDTPPDSDAEPGSTKVPPKPVPRKPDVAT